MNEFRDFTSLPPEEEAQFIVYEQRTQFWAKRALRIGVISSVIFGILIIIIVFSHEKPENLMADDDIGMLGDKEDIAKQRSDMKGSDTQPAPTYTPSTDTEPQPETTTPEATPAEGSPEAAEGGGGEAAAPEAAAPEAAAPEGESEAP